MIVGLVVSVALHELGHLLPAKKFGALVPEYWIGFGPVLFSKLIGTTTYGIRAVLLGGYVRIVGMFPPSNVPVAGRKPDSGVVAEARRQSGLEIAAARDEGLEGTPFYELKTSQKLTVMMGGPLMNLLLAFLLTVGTVTGFGWMQASATVAEVVPSVEEIEGGEGDTPSPASQAGVQPGDRIVAWDSQPVDSWDEFTELLGASDGTEVILTVDRDGTQEDLKIVPTDSGDGYKIGVVAQVERVHGTVADAARTTWQMVIGTGKAILQLPRNLWDLVVGISTGAPRDAEGVVSVVGVARLAGEVATVDGPGVGISDRVAALLSLLASLNVALFVFNLIPLPPLDGGHVAGAAWGGLRNTWARLRGKSKPLPSDTAKMVPISYAVFIALVGLSVILMVADIFKPMQWG